MVAIWSAFFHSVLSLAVDTSKVEAPVHAAEAITTSFFWVTLILMAIYFLIFHTDTLRKKLKQVFKSGT